MFKGRFTQLPIYAEEQRVETLVRLRRLDSELTGRELIAADRYTIADITAQVALDLFTSLAHQPFPSELSNVRRWYNALSARPSARAWPSCNWVVFASRRRLSRPGFCRNAKPFSSAA
jgi:glutathione S-transferase